jgi:hypothetical protein
MPYNIAISNILIPVPIILTKYCNMLIFQAFKYLDLSAINVNQSRLQYNFIQIFSTTLNTIYNLNIY